MLLQPEIVRLGEIKIAGVAVTTSNEKENTEDGQIIALYEHFLKENVSEKILNKRDDRIIALYCDYEDGESGEYVYALGHQIIEDDDSFELFEIPPMQYLHFRSERGYLNDVLPALWRDIWQKTQEGTLEAERTFIADLEFHNYEDHTSPDTTVDIFLSI